MYLKPSQLASPREPSGAKGIHSLVSPQASGAGHRGRALYAQET